jgi:ACS family hexuronate transporter-like MFS transporter
MPPIPAQTEGARWTTATWAVCIVLLLASTLNYMDRQTLGNVQTRIEKEFSLNNEDYGNVELGFGIAFAVGAIVFGVTADMVNVRWLYPAMIVLWSAAGAATGFCKDYQQLLICRVLLGFFEAAHWPCALRTTQRLLAPSERTFGNSLLQSGTSIGAIITPLMIKVMVIQFDTGWRMPFLVIGGLGFAWLIAWFAVSHQVNLAPEEAHAEGKDEAGWWKEKTFIRRFVVMILVVVSINAAWQLFRAWLPKFLEQGRGYSENERLLFTAAFNAATDVGCVLAGIATVWLTTHGMRSVGLARRVVFTGCAICSAFSLFIPWLPKGPMLLGVLLVIAAGMLGLFPCYYTWSQDLSRTHQGKVTGLLSTIAWLASAPIQKYYGKAIDWTIAHNEKLKAAGEVPWIGPFDAGLALIGCTPLIASVAVWLWWEGRTPATGNGDGTQLAAE